MQILKKVSGTSSEADPAHGITSDQLFFMLHGSKQKHDPEPAYTFIPIDKETAENGKCYIKRQKKIFLLDMGKKRCSIRRFVCFLPIGFFTFLFSGGLK